MATKSSKNETAKNTAKESTQMTLETKKPANSVSADSAVKKEEKTAEKVVEKEAVEQKGTELKETAKRPGRPAGSKTDSTGKKATRRPATKKIVEAARTELIIQYQGRDYSESEMMKQVVKIWEAEGKKATAVKKINLYVQPENNKAYYVINEGMRNEAKGDIDL